jgi:aspartate aminotransferase-like enzyme
MHYNQSDAFGLGSKFKECHEDIRRAGSCLALQEGTACIFHLMRAMEVAVRKLSRRLNIEVTAKTTWRVLTGAMDGKIKAMPDTTEAQKRKKNKWEEARANLHHVGSVWRNNTMHPATSYTPSEARDVFNAVRIFMRALAEL